VDVRHTVLSLQVSGGASFQMTAKLLGHASDRNDQPYAHLGPVEG